MTCAERRAVAFVHLIAEWHPEPGSPIGLAVTAARRLSVAPHVEAGTHIAAPVLPPVAGTVRAASSFPPSLDAAHTIKEPTMNDLQAVPIDGGYVVKRTPGRVHGTFDKAAAEAVRLTAANDGPAFIVLKIVGVVIGGGGSEE